MKRNSSVKRNQSENLKSFPLSQFIKNSIKERIYMAMLNFSAEFIEREVMEFCGEKGKRNSSFSRYGFDPHAWAYMFGQKVPIKKQRVRAKDGSGELELRHYNALHDSSLIDEEVMKHLLHGCSTRNYDKVITSISGKSGTSKSTVSDVFIKASQNDLDELNGRDLKGKNIFAILIDGIEFDGEHLIASLGIQDCGSKIILGIRSGSTESSEVVRDLLNDLEERGLEVKNNTIFILDGSKALRKGVRSKYDRNALIVRCWKHKVSNIEEYIPDNKHRELWSKMKRLAALDNYADACQEYENIFKWLKSMSERAANSLREAGYDLILLQKLNCPAQLRRSLYTTNLIESLFSVIRRHSSRVKRWRKGSGMTERWFASFGLQHERTRMRKIVGKKLLPEFLERLRNFSLDEIKEVA